MARDRWYRGFGVVRVRVRCQRQWHHITWRGGALVVEDHDVPAEMGLAALGAEGPHCVRIYQAWRRLHRGFDDELLARLESGQLPRPAPRCAGAATTRTSDADLLPDPLGRLALWAALVRAERNWHRAGLPQDARQRLESLLLARARQVVTSALAPYRPYRPLLELAVSCVVTTRHERASAAFELRHHQARLELRLPLRWLLTVWDRGIAVVDGGMVIEAGIHGPGWLRVMVLEWELRGFYGLDAVLTARDVPAPAGR